MPNHPLPQIPNEKAARDIFFKQHTKLKRIFDRNLKPSDRSFRNMVLSQKGVLKDKIATLSLSVQEDLITHWDSFLHLLQMAEKNQRMIRSMAFSALYEIFAEQLLPKNRYLKTWAQNSSFPQKIRTNPEKLEEAIIRSIQESQIKFQFSRFCDCLIEAFSDTVDYHKLEAMTLSQKLILQCPEARIHLLPALVNKLGDPKRKVSARAQYYLNTLIAKNKALAMETLTLVFRFFDRPGIDYKSKYFATVLLSSIKFNRNSDDQLPMTVLKIYLTEFDQLVESKKNLEKQMSKYQHIMHKQLSKQAKHKQAIKHNSHVEDSNMIDKLVALLLNGVNRVLPYCNLENKANADFLNQHSSSLFFLAKTSKHIKTQLQSLILLQSICKTPQLYTRYLFAFQKFCISIFLADSTQLALALTLINDTFSSEEDLPVLITLVRHVLSAFLVFQKPAALCALLIIISEQFRAKNKLFKCLSLEKPIQANTLSIDEKPAIGLVGISDGIDTSVPSESAESSKRSKKKSKQVSLSEYSADIPLVEDFRIWEISTCAHHYHPSVSTFAKQLLEKKFIVYQSNPLEDFKLRSFLDRFVFKAPKKRKPSQNSSALQPQTISIPKYTVAANMVDEKSLTQPEDQFLQQFLSQKHIQESALTFRKTQQRNKAREQILNRRIERTTGTIDLNVESKHDETEQGSDDEFFQVSDVDDDEQSLFAAFDSGNVEPDQEFGGDSATFFKDDEDDFDREDVPVESRGTNSDQSEDQSEDPTVLQARKLVSKARKSSSFMDSEHLEQVLKAQKLLQSHGKKKKKHVIKGATASNPKARWSDEKKARIQSSRRKRPRS